MTTATTRTSLVDSSSSAIPTPRSAAFWARTSCAYSKTSAADRLSARSEQLRAYARKALPALDGRVRVTGLEAPIEIIRDQWGMAHIYASSLHDAYFGQGFITAADRLWQVELA